MTDVMYTAPSDNTIDTVIITEACVKEGAPPDVIKKKVDINIEAPTEHAS